MAGAGVIRTRFAPSPTGALHLGHAFSALTAARLAEPGEFMLRIEDIDRDRCRPEFEAGIFADLRWLGLDWPEPVLRQTDRMEAYAEALDRLAGMGVLYPCCCRRGDIRAAMSAPQEGVPMTGPDGLIYPGTCRRRTMDEAGSDDIIRLDAAKALKALNSDRLTFRDTGMGLEVPHEIRAADFIAGIGDVALARRGMGTSYHLAVTLDDAFQGITLVSRGKDLFASTWIHRLLQKLLRLPQPTYYHHELIRDGIGKRLAKRDDARALENLRESGVTPREIRQSLGLS